VVNRQVAPGVRALARTRRAPKPSGLQIAWLAAALLAGACDSPPSAANSRKAPSVIASAAPRPPEAALIRGPSAGAEIAPFIAAELARAYEQHVRLLVYVGAKWCEPCRHFHDALLAGELAGALPALRFIEFDYDSDEPALRRGGYVSKLIPLFTLPNPDGSASVRHIEGSIKGPDAVLQNLLPRLQALLAMTATSR
jgi:hypothetical protein